MPLGAAGFSSCPSQFIRCLVRPSWHSFLNQTFQKTTWHSFACAESTYVCDNSCLALHDPLIRAWVLQIDGGPGERGSALLEHMGTGCIHGNSGARVSINWSLNLSY